MSKVLSDLNNTYCVYVYLYLYMFVCPWVCIYTYAYIIVYFPLTYSFSCCCCCCCFVVFSFTLFSYFRSDLRDHNEHKAFLPILCYPSHCWCYSYLSAVIFRLHLLYFNFLPICLSVWLFCLFVCLFVLFRLIFRFNKVCNFSSFI